MLKGNCQERTIELTRSQEPSITLQECFNDTFENGFQNDKLPLLFKENINAKDAIKRYQEQLNHLSSVKS